MGVHTFWRSAIRNGAPAAGFRVTARSPRLGKAWEGLGRLGKAWEGLGRLGKAWEGLGRLGKAGA
jgi:hypothetical protein